MTEFVPWYEDARMARWLSFADVPKGRVRRSDEETIRVVRKALLRASVNPTPVCADIHAILEGRI